MKTALFCKCCNSRLTNWVFVISTVEEMNIRCDIRNDDRYDEEVHPVPKGYALRIEDKVLRELKLAMPGWEPQQHPEYWMNLNDVRWLVGRTDDRSRLNGCCGLDGCDGPNRICSCGTEV